MSDGLHRSCAGPGRVEGGVQPSPPPQFLAGDWIAIEVNPTIPDGCFQIGDSMYCIQGTGVYRWTGGSMPRANASVTSIEITGTAQVQGGVRETPSERMARRLRGVMHPVVHEELRARPATNYFAGDPVMSDWTDYDMPDTYTRRRSPTAPPDPYS